MRLTLFPGESSTSYSSGGARHGFLSSHHKLVPRDYLNASAHDPAPFSFCPINGPGDALARKYTPAALHKTILHPGSNARVQRVINKAMRGLPVTISILGGSISACHGAGDDPLATGCYPTQVFQWWNEVFPHPASELTNGARRRTDSSYFAYCHAQHLPDTADLVILEFDTEDPYDEVALDHFELLVRSILLRPEQPAVIVLGHFAPQLQGIHGFAGPEQLHTLVAQFYDLPHITLKGAIYHEYLENPSLAAERYFTDMVLANEVGHSVIADVLVHYLQSQICSAWSTAKGYSFDSPVFTSDLDTEGSNSAGESNPDAAEIERRAAAGDNVASGVPPFFMSTRPDINGGSRPYRFHEVKPYCASANDLINPLPATLFVGSGWHQARPKRAVLDSATPADAYYWHATYPKSKLRVPVKINAGDVAVWYLTQEKGRVPSSVMCWVDNNINGGVTISGEAESGDDGPTPKIKVIDHFVSEGSHYVECQLQGVEGVQVNPFKLLGIFAS
ncbi:capsular associated protein [Clavulina sp. PMI_390]|nr:capsular associated protein [Clavulina sp. PMI_390]